jgi:hypothetical protein
MLKDGLVVLGVLLATSLWAQTTQVFKWTDGSGNVHFTDKPHPGAEEIPLPSAQPSSSAQPPNPTPIKQEAQGADEQVTAYQNISIVQPSEQETIRNSQGYISVILDIQPKLMPGDKVQMIYDGAPVGEPLATTVIALQDVHRGSHTLAAQILDGDGNLLMKSATITIYMMPPRVGMGQRSP